MDKRTSESARFLQEELTRKLHRLRNDMMRLGGFGSAGARAPLCNLLLTVAADHMRALELASQIPADDDADVRSRSPIRLLTLACPD